jgi:drug/metabolite transporter (DMT)-like permease
MAATSTMYAGLTMTSASSSQMLRGALIVFTGVFSVVFLKRKLRVFHWIGILFIIFGLIVVGLQDLLAPKKSDEDMNRMLLGNALSVIAQVLTATQMILEEKFLTGKEIAPLEAVGLEGLFGVVVLSSLLYPLSYIKVFQKGAWVPIEDPIDAFYQIRNSWQIAMAVVGNVFSIAFFNFAGVSVTKEMSATTRTVLDSIRTLTVWAASLAFGWESLSYLQPFGFLLLVIGMFVYNDVLVRPWLIRKGYIVPTEDHEELINDPELNGQTIG